MLLALVTHSCLVNSPLENCFPLGITLKHPYGVALHTTRVFKRQTKTEASLLAS